MSTILSLAPQNVGILQINDIYQKFASVLSFVEIVSWDGIFHGLTLYDGSKVREKAAPYNSE